MRNKFKYKSTNDKINSKYKFQNFDPRFRFCQLQLYLELILSLFCHLNFVICHYYRESLSFLKKPRRPPKNFLEGSFFSGTLGFSSILWACGFSSGCAGRSEEHTSE